MLDVRPVTTERWADLAALAGERGFQGGCWCMWWRLPNREFRECSSADNRDAIHALVRAGRAHRRTGVTQALLDAAVVHAARHGAEQAEGYPIDTAERTRAGADLYTGSLAIFERAGFVEVARRGGRPIVRKRLA